MQDIARFLGIISTFFLLVPLATVIFYWIKKGFLFDKRGNVLGISILANTIIFFWGMYLSFQHTNNLFLLRFLNLSEIFLLSYFLLSLVSSKKIILFLAPFIFLTAAFLADIFWGSPGSNPAEQTSVVSILLISLIIIAMRFPWKKTKNNKAYYSFITAITINVVNSLIGVSFIEVLTEVTVVLVSLLNLIAYSFYTIGFYRLIKN